MNTTPGPDLTDLTPLKAYVSLEEFVDELLDDVHPTVRESHPCEGINPITARRGLMDALRDLDAATREMQEQLSRVQVWIREIRYER